MKILSKEDIKIKNNSLIFKTLESIRDGNFISRVKGYFTYETTIVRMQMNLNKLAPLKDIGPFYVREVNINNEEDIIDWLEIINDGYVEESYGINDAKNHFRNHLFLDISGTYFIMSGKKPVATISMGRYRNDTNVGGDSRKSVKKEYQGNGLGKYLVLYGFHKLKENGVSMAETMIQVKRKPSIFIHLKCGFEPQTDLRKSQFRDHTFILNRIIADYKIKRMYHTYKNGLLKMKN